MQEAKKERGQKRHIKMAHTPASRDYSIVADHITSKANVTYNQVLDLCPLLRKELKSGLALQSLRSLPLDEALRDSFQRRRPTEQGDRSMEVGNLVHEELNHTRL